MKRILLAIFLFGFSSASFAWENIVQNDPYKYIFTSSTSVKTIKSTAGILHALTVTGGTSSTINIFDGAAVSSGLIYSFTATNALATYILDVGFTSGCTVVTNGALQYTVSYK